MIEKAVKLNPTNSAYLDSLGWVLFKQGHAKDALAPIRKAIELNGEPDATLFDHLGDVYAALNQIDKARYYVQGSPNMTDDYKGFNLKPNDPVEIAEGPFGGSLTNKDNGSNYQRIRFRHVKDTVGNVLFVDGHVEALKYNPQTKSSTLLRKNLYVNLQQ